MSRSINEIKAKIASMQNMEKITKAMQMVSASKLAKTERKVRSYEYYTQILNDIMKSVMASPLIEDHIFFNPESSKRCTAFLIITSDRGLAGGYNNNIGKLLQQEIADLKKGEYKLYMIGSKGFDFARRFELKVENKGLFIPDDVIYLDAEPIVKQIIYDYAHGHIDEVVILYNHYVTQLLQEPTKKQVLPLEKKVEKQATNDIYIYEPGENEIVQATLIRYISSAIYGTILNAKLSEHAARMVAMRNATDNASEIIKDTRLEYNRARQAAITQEINEIVGGAMAIQ